MKGLYSELSRFDKFDIYNLKINQILTADVLLRDDVGKMTTEKRGEISKITVETWTARRYKHGTSA